MAAKRKIQNRRKVNLLLEQETYDNLEKLAALRGGSTTVSDIIRESIDYNLTANYCVENIDLITKIMREELQDILKPALDRIAALSSKSCVQAATASYLNAEALSRFVPEKERMDVKEGYDAARKKGVAYVKGKTISG